MEVVIISKSKYEEMVGKLNRLSDRAGWTTKRSANSCASVRAPCRRSATTARWLTRR